MALTDEDIDRIDNEIDYPVYVEGRDELIAQAKEATRLRAALREALDIADYEASEYQGKPEHLIRLPQLRAIAEGKP